MIYIPVCFVKNTRFYILSCYFSLICKCRSLVVTLPVCLLWMEFDQDVSLLELSVFFTIGESGFS